MIVLYIILSGVSVFIGAVIASVVAKHYYEFVAQDLEKEAKELRRINVLMLMEME